MRTRSENRVSNALLVSLLSMLIPMILASRVFSSSYLSIFYMIGYTVQFVSIFYVFSKSTIQINRNSVILLICYLICLCLPLINDVIQGIPINYFDPINSLIKIVNFFIFFTLMENTKIEEKSLLNFMRCIVFLSVVACLYSIIFEFNDILSIRYVTNTNALKIRSFFSNRNQYSAFLIVALTSNLYSYQLKRTKVGILVFVLQLFCILTTFSRAALFSAIIIICLMFLQLKKSSKKIIIMAVILIVGIGILFTTGVFGYFLKNYVRWEQSADSGRFNLWKYAWDVAKINLFTGVGFYTGVDIAIANGMGLTQFHNMFVDILVDGGIFELSFFLGIMLLVYKRCVKNCTNQSLMSVYRASLVAFIFHACVESLSVFALSYSDTMYSIFFISLPLLMANIKETGE